MARTGGETADAPGSVGTIEGDGIAVALDGWFANHAELARDLEQRGLPLKEETGSELLRRAWQRWGRAMLPRLKGEFAFVLWDRRSGELICARDHHGLRPLFYHWDGKALAVASELAAVLAVLDRQPAPNLGFLAEHMANEWYSLDETPWQGVLRVPQAHVLRLRNGTPVLEEYWQLPTEVTIRYRSDKEYVEHYREVLFDCVKRASRTSAPLACEVSGGLDSSAVFAVADALDKDGELPAPALFGMTMRGTPGTDADELGYALAVGQKVGREIAQSALFEPPLDWFVAQGRRDRLLPFPPNTAMSLSAAEAMAQRGAHVCLTGQGGDVWLDGASRQYLESLRLRDWHGLMAHARADAGRNGWRSALRGFGRRGLLPLMPDGLKQVFGRGSARQAQPEEARGWLSPMLETELDRRRERYLAGFADVPRDARYKIEKLKYPFHGLVLDMFASQSARLGMEYRHPMLSRQFVEFSAATPEHVRSRGDSFKYVHREAMRGLLPREVIERSDKAHFTNTFTRLLPGISNDIAGWTAGQSRHDLFVHGAAELMTASTRQDPDSIPVWELWGIWATIAMLTE